MTFHVEENAYSIIILRNLPIEVLLISSSGVFRYRNRIRLIIAELTDFVEFKR